ncbi:Ig-like domain-containing protein [Candidatus Palauibacter sp.]|uniref:Ig-like domain-containing protein n=1 Tax=Candidatus Palauibacter sp. TaxID=3101350 RepID=UPI003C6F10A5
MAVGSIPAQVLTAGQAVTVDVTPFFSDPDGGTLTYTATSSDDGVVSVSLSGSNLTVTAVAAGTATVTVTATDPDGLTATQTAGVTVEAANQAPEAVGAIPPRTMTAGQTVTVDVSSFFSDPDGDELTYTVESSDADVLTASMSGSSLTATAVAAGTATVTVTAADPDGLTAMQSVEVTVEAANQAPEAVGAIPPQAMTAGDEVTVDVTSFFSDPDGDELTYTAESSDAAVVAVSVSGSSLTVTAVAAGTATVTVTAADPDGLTATQSAEVTVEAANQAPEAVGAIPPQAMTAGDEMTVDVTPFFSDPDGDELTYTAESSDAAVVAVSVSGSSLTVTAVVAGTATVTVTAADPGGLMATQSAEVTVEAANQAPEAVGTIPSQSLTEGDEVTVDVSSFFSDPDGDELTYTAESSDAAVVAVSLSGSSLTVTAVAVGTATVTVTAADPEGLTATQSAAVAVGQANQAPEALGSIPAQTMTEGDAVTLDVSSFFSDPEGEELTYTAESSDADAVTAGMEGSSLTVTAVAVGTATVTVTAADPEGLTAAQSAEVTVEAPNQAPEAVGAIPARAMTEGDEVVVDVSPFFSDPDGDELTYTAESSDAAVVAASVEGSSLTVTAVSVGTATVTVTAADPEGLTAAQSAEVTVEAANQAPEAVGAIPARAMTEGDEVVVDVSSFFSDPDGDELTYTAESSDAAVVAVGVEGSSVTVTAVAEGSATVTVTAADPDGLTATQSADVMVEARTGFRDDFDSDASLDDWTLYSTAAEVVDGVLHLTGTDDRLIGTADRVLETPVTEWALGTRMARTAADELGLVYWVTGHDRFSRFRLATGAFSDGDNWKLGFREEPSRDYFTIGRFHGNSDAIAEEAGEFMDITFSSQNGEFVLVVGDTELFRLATSGTIDGVPVSDFVGRVEEVWLGVGSDETSLFDWVDLAGTEIGGRMADRPEAPGIGSLRRTKDLDPAPLDIPTEAISLKKGR